MDQRYPTSIHTAPISSLISLILLILRFPLVCQHGNFWALPPPPPHNSRSDNTFPGWRKAPVKVQFVYFSYSSGVDEGSAFQTHMKHTLLSLCVTITKPMALGAIARVRNTTGARNAKSDETSGGICDYVLNFFTNSSSLVLLVASHKEAWHLMRLLPSMSISLVIRFLSPKYAIAMKTASGKKILVRKQNLTLSKKYTYSRV